MSASSKARIGFIGAGWWATSNHMPLLAARDDVELAAVCRLGADELQQVQERFGFGMATQDYRELLEVDLDGVVVASPHTLHHEHARAVLERGLHLMCEKPMTTQAEHARELVELAQAQNVALLVPYGWHYKPFVQRAKKLMDDGAVGRIEYVLCHMASPIRGLLSGDALDLDDVSGGSEAPLFSPDPATWADPERAGGGYGHAQVSHSSGMLFWLTGLRAEHVFAVMSAPGAQVDLYDAVTVRFAEGAIGSVSGAGNVPTDQTFQVDLRIFGEEGMLLLDCERARVELKRHDGAHEIIDVDPASGGYECDGPPANFVDLILGRTETNWAPGEAAMRGVEMLDAAYRSAASGREERV
ncbi:MAG TPA: Gfo/Idh/MocA family oxidoreductase [Candidatus Latescibacteria bacterium]|jgi:predicted dehydrogenase|nr:oxidoreductase [Gemmatimonadaceae bacterium]MDP6014623.1 Gfo/Idh/MocA family oxidoreductase [Candidatus Latescibacterota bacterium]HJP30131.1 Gfo/Idh/MocA family oxidoreductase [Candidatus Latescibacterota bacterium]